MTTLLVVLPPTQVSDGRVALADKTVSGLEALASRWPGRVVATFEEERASPTANLGVRWHDEGSLPVELEACATDVAIRRHRPSVVQLPLAVQADAWVDLAPAVVVAENTALMKWAYARTTSLMVDRPRMFVGALRQERVYRSVRRRAGAVACNGWGAWRAYGSPVSGRAAEPILFFDNRIRPEVLTSRSRSERAPGELVLAFSGRLHPGKGPHFAIRASRVLQDRGVAHTLHVLGDGPLRGELSRSAPSSVVFHGDLPFETGWVPFVREQVDLMLLPHVQGDPSGTYLECAALGVPVLGFDNAAMRGHEHVGGFARRARRRSASSLADLVEVVWHDHRTRTAMANAGRRFMDRENMDAEFDRRVGQLLEVASAATKP